MGAAEPGRPVSNILIKCFIECRETTRRLKTLQKEQKKTMAAGKQLADGQKQIQNACSKTGNTLREVTEGLTELKDAYQFTPKIDVGATISKLEQLMKKEIELEKQFGKLQDSMMKKMKIGDVEGVKKLRSDITVLMGNMRELRETRKGMIEDLRREVPGIKVPLYVESKQAFQSIGELNRQRDEIKKRQEGVMKSWIKASKEGSTELAEGYRKQFETMNTELGGLQTTMESLVGPRISVDYMMTPPPQEVGRYMLQEINSIQERIKGIISEELPPQTVKIYPEVFEKLTPEKIVEGIPIVKVKQDVIQEVTRVLKEQLKIPEPAVQEIIRKVVEEPEELPRARAMVVEINKRLLMKNLKPLTEMQSTELEFAMMPTGMTELENSIRILKDARQSHIDNISAMVTGGKAATEAGKGRIEWEQRVADEYTKVLGLLARFPKIDIAKNIKAQARSLLEVLEQVKASIHALPSTPEVMKEGTKDLFIKCKVLCEEATQKVRELTTPKETQITYQAKVPVVRVEPLKVLVEYVTEKFPEIKIPELVQKIIREYEGDLPPETLKATVDYVLGKIPELPEAFQTIIFRRKELKEPQLKELTQFINLVHKEMPKVKPEDYIAEGLVEAPKVEKPEIPAAEVPITCKLICMKTTTKNLGKITKPKEVPIDLPHAGVKRSAGRINQSIGNIGAGMTGLTRSIGSSFEMMSDRAERFRATQLRWIGRDLMRIGFMITIYGRMFSETFQKAAKASVDLEGALMDVGDVLEDIADVIGTTIAPIIESLRGPLEMVQDFLETHEAIATVVGIVILLGTVFVTLASQLFSIIGTLTVLRFGLLQISGSALGAKTEVKGLGDMFKLLFEVLLGAAKVQQTIVQQLGLTQQETKAFSSGIDDSIVKMEAFLGSEQALNQAGYKLTDVLKQQEDAFKEIGKTSAEAGEKITSEYSTLHPVMSKLTESFEQTFKVWQEGKDAAAALLKNSEELRKKQDALKEATKRKDREGLKAEIEHLQGQVGLGVAYNQLQSEIVRTTKAGRDYQNKALKGIKASSEKVIKSTEKHKGTLSGLARQIRINAQGIVEAVKAYREEHNLIGRTEKAFQAAKGAGKKFVGLLKLIGRGALGVFGSFVLMKTIQPIFEGLEGPLDVIADVIGDVVDVVQPFLDAFADFIEFLGELGPVGKAAQIAIAALLIGLMLFPRQMIEAVAGLIKFIFHIGRAGTDSLTMAEQVKQSFTKVGQAAHGSITPLELFRWELQMIHDQGLKTAQSLQLVTSQMQRAITTGGHAQGLLKPTEELGQMFTGTAQAEMGLEGVTFAMENAITVGDQLGTVFGDMTENIPVQQLSQGAYGFTYMTQKVEDASVTFDNVSKNMASTVQVTSQMGKEFTGTGKEISSSQKGLKGAVKGLKGLAAGAFKGFAYLTLFGIALEALQPVLEPLAEAMRMMFEPLEPIFELIGDWVEENPELVQGLFLMVAGLWAANKIMGPFGGVLGVIGKGLGGLGTGADTASGGLSSFTKESAANLLAIAAIVAALSLLVNSFANIVKVFKESEISIDQFVEVLAAVSVAAGGLVAVIGLIGKAFGGSLDTALVLAGISAVVAALSLMINAFSSFVKSAGESGQEIGDIINLILALSVAMAILVGVIELMAGIMGKLGGTWKTALGVGAIAVVVGSLSLLVNSFGDFLRAVGESGMAAQDIINVINAMAVAMGALVTVIGIIAVIMGATGPIGLIAVGAIAAFAALIASLAFLVTALAEFIKGIVEMGKHWKKVKKMILEIGPTLIKGIENTVDEILRVIETKVPEWVRKFAEGLRKIADAITSNAPSIIDSFSRIFSSLADIVIKSVDSIISNFARVFTEILGVIGTKSDEIIQAFVSMAVGIAGSLEEGISEIVVGFSNMFSEVFSTLGTQIPLVVEKFSTMIGDITIAVGTGINDIIDTFGDMVIDIANRIGEKASLVINAIGDIIKGIISEFGKNAEDIVDLGGDVIVNVISGMVEKVDDIGDAVSGLISEIGDEIVDNIDLITEYGGKIVTAIKDGIIAGIDVVKGAVGEVIDHIIEGCPGGGLKDFPLLGYSAGNQMSRSIAEGTKGSIAHIKDSVGVIGEVIVDGVEDMLTNLASILCFSHIIPEAIEDAMIPSSRAMNTLGSSLENRISDVFATTPELRVTGRFEDLIAKSGTVNIPAMRAVQSPAQTNYNQFYITVQARELSPRMTDAEKRNLAEELSKMIAERTRRS